MKENNMELHFILIKITPSIRSLIAAPSSGCSTWNTLTDTHRLTVPGLAAVRRYAWLQIRWKPTPWSLRHWASEEEVWSWKKENSFFPYAPILVPLILHPISCQRFTIWATHTHTQTHTCCFMLSGLYLLFLCPLVIPVALHNKSDGLPDASQQ